MITVGDMAPRGFTPAVMPAWAPAAGAVRRAKAPFRERLLMTVLFAAVLSSCVAFIEPSPHDALMGALAIVALAAGVRFHRILLIPFTLLLVWNFFGLLTLFNVPDQKETVQYAATSVYLAIAALIFALIVADKTMPRMAALEIAYVMAAMISALCGIAGYFHLVPGAAMFTLYDRAMGMFKDPNVYGPFLILPLLFLLQHMIVKRINLLSLAVAGIIMFGLLLGFSRGSWFAFAVGLAVVIVLSFLTAPTPKVRMRIIGLSIAGLAALAVLLVLLLTMTSLGSMFSTRAQLIQSYDVGTGGRFVLQELAIGSVLEFPNGMGPFEFSRIFGLQQHNVYLQAFLVYGWGGGFAYVLLVLTTLWVGFANALKCRPWQGYAIAAIGTFFGVALEGFIIDTDHWRSFFLVLGLIWGLAAATRAAGKDLPAAATMVAPREAPPYSPRRSGRGVAQPG
ncbi:O-antigen ligase family protein [Undibacter mobilis]|uniref:O-antigen ligase domain-containing protein n=1 Tax=Undibacter mobilis TaxID=2292256 RepID=A0A371B1C4_9BRAD|nr:O-antigen ligase domain-containing protein [Undibacter mobilis]RDV01332.1 O-antigen ligase domain-containing protein [Undibacter mobilis]